MATGTDDRSMRARRTLTFLIVALVAMVLALVGLIWFYLAVERGRESDPVEVTATGGVEMLPGDPIYGFGKDADSQFKRPHDVNVGPDGDLYVADLGNGRVVRLKPDGSLVATFGTGEWGPGKLDSPTGVAVGADGRVYVADAGAHGPHGKILILTPDLAEIEGEVFYKSGDSPIMVRVYGDKLYATSIAGVHIHDLDGVVLNEWGGAGKAEGQFSYPNGIALLPDGTIVVAESNNRRLQYFDPRGTFLKAVGEPPKSNQDATGQFGLPMGIAIDERGIMYLADAFDYNVKLLGPSGGQFASVGDFGSSKGQFNAPGGIVRMQGGRFWLADELNNRIVPFELRIPEGVLPDDVLPASGAQAVDIPGLLSGSTCLWVVPLLLLIVVTAVILGRRAGARRAQASSTVDGDE